MRLPGVKGRMKESAVDRDEKARMRNYIGEHLDLAGTRLSDFQAQRLVDFIDNYDQYRGRSFERNSTHRGFSSEGRYVRSDTVLDTFTDAVGIHRDTYHRYDDGQEDHFPEDITTARGILDWLDSNG
jgi:hypothetical protein